MGVGEFVAGVDRLLTRAHGLFAAGAGDGAGGVFAAGGGRRCRRRLPVAVVWLVVWPRLVVCMSSRGPGCRGSMSIRGRPPRAGGAVAGQGRAGAGVIRDQARTVAAATAPMGNSAAGARLVVAAMDQHLAAMQRQLDTTTEQNRVLALRLRQLAEAYRGAGSARDGRRYAAGRDGWFADGQRRPWCGGGGLSGLSGLAALPASLMSRSMGGRSAQWSAAEPGREAVVLPVLLRALFRCRRCLLRARGCGRAGAPL